MVDLIFENLKSYGIINLLGSPTANGDANVPNVICCASLEEFAETGGTPNGDCPG